MTTHLRLNVKRIENAGRSEDIPVYSNPELQRDVDLLPNLR